MILYKKIFFLLIIFVINQIMFKKWLYTNNEFNLSFQAADEGLPPPLQEDDNVADTKIRQSEALYDTLLAEEAAGQAKGEGEMDHQLSEEKRRQESEKLQDHLVCIQNLVKYSNQSVGDIF